MFPFQVIVAADERGGIGIAGDLPWRIPDDLRRFRLLTTGAAEPAPNAVIMGRRTWESIPDRFRPLKRRLNIVLSRKRHLLLPPGVLQAQSMDEALALSVDSPDRFVIGGGLVYEEALRHPCCRLIHLTRVATQAPCDTYLPPLEDWETVAVHGRGAVGELRFEFLELARREEQPC